MTKPLLNVDKCMAVCDPTSPSARLHKCGLQCRTRCALLCSSRGAHDGYCKRHHPDKARLFPQVGRNGAAAVRMLNATDNLLRAIVALRQAVADTPMPDKMRERLERIVKTLGELEVGIHRSMRQDAEVSNGL